MTRANMIRLHLLPEVLGGNGELRAALAMQPKREGRSQRTVALLFSSTAVTIAAKNMMKAEQGSTNPVGATV